MKTKNIYIVSIFISLLCISCRVESNKVEKTQTITPQKIFRGDTTISDTTIFKDYMLHNIIGYGKKTYYIKSIKAEDYYMNYKPKEGITYKNAVSVMYEKSKFVYDSIICSQTEYKGEEAPIGYKNVFVSNIKTNIPVLKDILTNNKYTTLSAICIVDTTFPIIEDSLKVFSISNGLKTSSPISFKHIESLDLYSIDMDTANFIHNSDIDTLDLSISNVRLLNFENTKINVLNISYSPNVDIVSLKKNDLIKNIIIYDENKEEWKIIK